MYLKQIKTHGFKSFADNIEIELHKGITGIVGPNGSGKSNIVDAIRWVLGEQSIKSLRGDDAMTDVIFSGSKSRKPLNTASVTLVFDNSDNYLPIAFSEVSIKRRVYKDGTNEYFINGEKCRLKDISDLLLDTGIAKESFNIISQGKIDEVINYKPSDRRIIFEEAAGVLKYKKRKEEALRKLERTNLNIQRIDDIIGELEVQIEPLQEQRDKAVTYLEYQSELEGIEISLIASDITNINDNYQTSKNKIEVLNNELLSISTLNSTNEAKIQDYKLKISNLDKELDILQQQLLKDTTLVEQLNSQKQIILERKKYEVDDAKFHNNLIMLTEEELALKNTIARHEQLVKQNNEELSKVNIVINELLNKNNLLIDNRRVHEITISNLHRNEMSIKNTIDALKESIENNSSLPYAAKMVLNNPKLRGIHDAIVNLINVDETYSKAISTALGASSGYVVVDNELSAKEAIAYLKENNVGRATFFPMNIIKEKYVDNNTLSLLNSLNGYIGVASSLIKNDNKYDGIIKNQLGNVLVVEDLDSANEISKKIDYKYKIVTIDGELIHVGGSITGGSEGKFKNIISEKYELEKCIKDLSKIETELLNEESTINQIDYDIKALEDKIYLVNKDKVNFEHTNIANQNQLQVYNDRLSSIILEKSGVNNILNKTLSDEEENIINEYYQSVSKKDITKNDLDIKLKEKTNLNDELDEYTFSLKRENNLFYEKSNTLKTLEIEVNRMDVKLDNLLNILNETYNMTYEHAKDNYHLEIPENTARSKVNQLKRLIKELGIVNIGAKEEYERIKTRYDFLTKQKTDLKQAEETLLEIIKEMDLVMESEFAKTFEVVRENFTATFKDLFKGGHADLKMTDRSNILETGIEIIASPPGKQLTSISLLSGGEKTFTAISLLFAILKSRPVPYCILDEAEAALDDSNVESFGNYITNLKTNTQFILITHKKKTMEFVDTLYGITMQESGVSRLVSVKMDEKK